MLFLFWFLIRSRRFRAVGLFVGSLGSGLVYGGVGVSVGGECVFWVGRLGGLLTWGFLGVLGFGAYCFGCLVGCVFVVV